MRSPGPEQSSQPAGVTQVLARQMPIAGVSTRWIMEDQVCFVLVETLRQGFLTSALPNRKKKQRQHRNLLSQIPGPCRARKRGAGPGSWVFVGLASCTPFSGSTAPGQSPS